MGAALVWGVVAASSLLVGTVLALLTTWRDAVVGVVLAFGAGALIASVAFELAEGGLAADGPLPLGVGIAAGALAFALGNAGVQRLGARRRRGAIGSRAQKDGSGTQSDDEGGGSALAFGALLDGIPEQAVLGIGLAAGQGVSVALLVAVWISNLPEAIGSAADLRGAGRSARAILGLWAVVAAVCAAATLGGFAIADLAGAWATSVINGFAAGALLVMLVDEMIPQARAKAGPWAGVVTVLGFAVAAGLSKLT